MNVPYTVPPRFARLPVPSAHPSDAPVAYDRYRRSCSVNRAYNCIMRSRLAPTRIERIRELNDAITWTVLVSVHAQFPVKEAA